MTSNPFLVDADPNVRASMTVPSARVRVRYHSFGLGLGAGRHDFEVEGEFLRDDGFNIVLKDDHEVLCYAPHCWVDDFEVLDD